MARAALLILVVALPAVLATLGVDISQPTSTSAFTCLKNNGYSFAVARVHYSGGGVDTHGAQSIANAWAAGLSHVDGYIFPCPHCGDGAAQIRETVNYLKGAGTKYGMLWLDIEGTQYWKDVNYNRAFFTDMANQLNSLQVNWGVYTGKSQWEPIMGSWSGGSSRGLWYAHYDNVANFNDFVPFGGWSKPAIKQFQGDVTVCGVGVDRNWYP